MSYHLALTSSSILFASGGYAFYKSKSVPSLLGSFALGSVFAASVYMSKGADNQLWAHRLGAFAGSGCLAIGVQRFSKSSNKFFPVILIALGVCNVSYHMYKIQEWS